MEIGPLSWTIRPPESLRLSFDKCRKVALGSKLPQRKVTCDRSEIDRKDVVVERAKLPTPLSADVTVCNRKVNAGHFYNSTMSSRW